MPYILYERLYKHKKRQLPDVYHRYLADVPPVMEMSMDKNKAYVFDAEEEAIWFINTFNFKKEEVL